LVSFSETEVQNEPVEMSSGLHFRPRVFVPLILFLALIVHLLLPRIAVLDQSLRVFQSLSIGVLTVALAAQALSYVANGALLRLIVVSSRERLPLRRATAIVMAASTVCLIAGGIVGYGAAVYEWTRKSGTSRETAAITAWLPSVFDAAALVVVALASAIELLHGSRLPQPAMVAVIVVVSLLLFVIIGSFLAMSRADRVIALLKRAPFLRSRLSVTIDELPGQLNIVSRALRQRGGVEAAACAMLNLVLDIFTLALVFLAAGYRVSPSVLIAGYGVPLLLGRFSFLPGGIAVVEVGMTALYTALGVPAHIAIAVILTYRFISFWLPTLAGIPVAIVLQTRGGAAIGK
jgi:uncharacterized protein (TIRG00374 family)